MNPTAQPSATAAAAPTRSRTTGEPVVLTRAARVSLVGDGCLAVVLGLTGLATAHLQAELYGLPAWLLLGSAVALLPYGARAVQAGRARWAPRGRVEGLALFNAVWAITVVALAAGRWVEPTPLGWLFLAAHAAIPATVLAALVRPLRG